MQFSFSFSKTGCHISPALVCWTILRRPQGVFSSLHSNLSPVDYFKYTSQFFLVAETSSNQFSEYFKYLYTVYLKATGDWTEWIQWRISSGLTQCKSTTLVSPNYPLLTPISTQTRQFNFCKFLPWTCHINLMTADVFLSVYIQQTRGNMALFTWHWQCFW